MLRSVGQAGQNEQGRVRVVPRFLYFFSLYYASRTTHDVVIPHPTVCCKKILLLNPHKLALEEKPSSSLIQIADVLSTIDQPRPFNRDVPACVSRPCNFQSGCIMSSNIQQQFGQIDIYVFDQILRGNIAAGMRILDAGCGSGRNLLHLLREGYEVFALDADANAVDYVRRMSDSLQSGLPAQNFQVGLIEQMPFPDQFADVVICNSVLHFARDAQQFRAMLSELWRVVKPGGMLFCRLGSRVGMDFEMLRKNIYRVGDNSEWFLVDEQMLLALTSEMNGVLVDPLKTTIVQNLRCMTTWVVRKPMSATT